MKKRILSLMLALTMCASLLGPNAMAFGFGTAPEAEVLTNEEEQAEATVFAAEQTGMERQILNFNKDWRFQKGENKSAGQKDFDDSDWRVLNLPHDYSIENDFDWDSPSADGGGYLDGGPAWYRKTWVIPEEMAGKRISIDFEGVYMNSKVYVNGTLMGEYPYGYSPFSYDITDYVVADGMTENVIAVYTNNIQPSSRWYSGSGIYRDVAMTVTEPVHVARYGVYVKTPNVETEYNNGNGPVTVGVDTKVENETDAATTVTVRHTTCYKGNLNGGGSDAVVATETTAPIDVAPGETVEIPAALSIANPHLWELGVGGLYELKTEVLVNGVVVDTYNTDYGLRWMKFDPVNGFFLNGEYTKMRGVCQHHDQGALGAVSNQAALDRQIRILRESGVNAIRSSHNPASRALLNACNEQGIMVMDEAFDTWYAGKNKNDFHLFFEQPCTHPDAEPGQTWPEFDLKNMIEGAKNDPSIIIWSIGNEVSETWYEKGFETAKQLSEWVREIDPIENNGRAVTIADPFPNAANYNPSTQSPLWKSNNNNDVSGFNYGTYDTYDQIHAYNPDWFVYSSETASAVSTRGEYFHPETEHWCEMPLTTHGGSRQCSEFDNDHVNWGTTMNYAIKEDIQRKYLGGVFFWTGFDYIGEPSPSKPYQAKSSYFGFVDTCGFPKDSFYMLQSQWLDVETDPMVHILPHWNWENDDSILIDGKMPLRVYSNAASVEMLLNGKPLGMKSFEQEAETTTSLAWQHDGSEDKNLYLEWLVEYEPGTVEAVAYDKNGNEIARDVKKTAGAPAALKLTPERSVITADGEDLAYIAVDIVDEYGVMNPDANNNIQFSISGNGRIVGTDNGNPLDLTNMKSENRSAFNGKAMVIVQSTTNSGSFTVTATSAGLPISSATVYTKAPESGDSGEILGYDAVSGKTTVGVQPTLPETVTARYADGTTDEKAVTWENASDADLSRAGYITVSGTVTGTGAAVTASVLVVAPVGVQPVNAVTTPGVQPKLPAKVNLVNSDGTSAEHDVTWDTIDGSALTDGATLTVTGTLSGNALEATAYVRVVAANTKTNVASASEGFATFDARYLSQYDPISEINDGVISYTDANKNGWTSWHGMGTGQEPTDTHWLSCTFAAELPVNNITFHFREDSGIYIPVTTTIQYWDGVAWQNVEHQSAYNGFKTNEGSTITFDSVTTDKLRAVFVRGDQVGDDGSVGVHPKDCVGITEAQITATIPPYGNSTATLSTLTVDGATVDGFDPAKTVYTVELPYDGAIPTVAATGADHATVLVLPAVSNNSAAIVRVTSEDGKTTQDYTVQFVQASPAVASAALRLEKDGETATEVVEDDILMIHVDATLENGMTVDPDLLDVKYTLSGAGTPPMAEVANGQLYAYKAGEVTLTAEITYLGEKTSATQEVTITPTENKKSIVSYSPVTVTTKLKEAPVLPNVIKAKFDLGLAQDVAVIWDAIDPSQYARYGSFTVSGTVAGQALRPTATVLVCDPIAAQNQSMATPVGIQPTLPETVKVYFSDGTSTYSAVTWSDDAPDVSTAGDVTIDGTTELGSLPVTLALRVTQDNVVASDNYAQLRTGFKYSLAFSDFTEASYDAKNLNNGKTDDKWCSYGVSAGNEQHIGVVFGKDNPGNRYVDTVKLYMLKDGSGLTATGIKDCTVQYYNKTFDVAGAPTDASNMLKQPDHPLNDEDNWADVTNQKQITEKPANESTEGIFVIGENTLTFDMIDTYALRLKLTTMGNNGTTFYLALSEIEAYGKSAVLNTDFTVSGITAGETAIDSFDPETMEYTVTVPTTDVPTVTATVDNNASVTVLPAPNIDGKTKVLVTSEDGLKTEAYTVSFETETSRYNVTVNGGVAYRTPAADAVFALTNEIVEKYAAGDNVTVVADEAPGFKAFDKWVTTDLELTEEQAAQSTMDFDMPGSDVILTATYKEKELTDAELVAQAKQKIGSSIVLPYAAYADESAKAAAATTAVNALIGAGVTAEVRYENDMFVLTLEKNAAGATIRPFQITVEAPPYNPPTGNNNNTTTETKKNEDGSTTKTVTDKKTGNVTATTTYPDGTKIVATTPKDGETSIEVTIPKGKDSVTVTIPTEKKPAPGEVAVIVKADGTREVIKTSVSTTDGLRVTLTGNAKLEILDNSKRFADVAADHWSADAIAFVTSRELFNGGDGGFQPAGDMSRAMLFTVLARLDGQDLTGGETWYEKAMGWAKESGVSDGSNPDASITRESLAVMLYRYAGSPEVGGMALGEFTDAERISDWATDAMLWCVDSGILNGSGGKLNPANTASRAEVAAMLMRFISTAK